MVENINESLDKYGSDKESELLKIKELASSLKEEIIEFTQKLIQTPSLSGYEDHIAELIYYQLQKLGYDDVFIDRVGNVIGIMKAQEAYDKNIVFSSHLDHGEPEDRNLWDYEPYSGDVDDEFIYGVGASDAKGAISTQIYSGFILKKLGLLKKGNYITAFIVQEGSAGCFGTKYLYEKTFKNKEIKPNLVILGNASSLNIYLGHRGRVELELTVYGRTNHSIIPRLGINAVYKSSSVIKLIEELAESMPLHPMLGESSISITRIKTLPESMSAVPDRCIISLDRRFLPFEGIDEVKGQIQAIIDKVASEDSVFKAEVKIRKEKITSYSGYSEEVNKLMLPFMADESSPLIKNIYLELKKLKSNTNLGSWYFNTDGGFTSTVMKIPTIGYSPGEEKYYGTPFEKVSIENMIIATIGNCLIYNVS